MPSYKKQSHQSGLRHAVASRQRSEGGFGLMEVVVTLFLIGVTLLLFQVTAKSLVLNKYNRYREVALRIADKELQTLRTTPFASLPSSGSFSDSLLSTLPNGQGAITITDINSRLKDVTVTVSWNNTSGTATQSIRLQTYIDQGGLGK